MKQRILFCGIGWAANYVGELDDKPKSSARYLQKKENIGHETLNFAEFNGKYYGFVETSGHDDATGNWKPNTIHIEKIDASAEDKDSIDHVLVVWVATNPVKGGRFVVGWYENAVVYRERQDSPIGSQRYEMFNSLDIRYMVEGKANHVMLLPIKERTYEVPSGKSGMGQSSIWYANGNSEELDFADKTIEYINRYNAEEDRFIDSINSEEYTGEDRDVIGKARMGQGKFHERLSDR